MCTKIYAAQILLYYFYNLSIVIISALFSNKVSSFHCNGILTYSNEQTSNLHGYFFFNRFLYTQICSLYILKYRRMFRILFILNFENTSLKIRISAKNRVPSLGTESEHFQLDNGHFDDPCQKGAYRVFKYFILT